MFCSNQLACLENICWYTYLEPALAILYLSALPILGWTLPSPSLPEKSFDTENPLSIVTTSQYSINFWIFATSNQLCFHVPQILYILAVADDPCLPQVTLKKLFMCQFLDHRCRLCGIHFQMGAASLRHTSSWGRIYSTRHSCSHQCTKSNQGLICHVVLIELINHLPNIIKSIGVGG